MHLEELVLREVMYSISQYEFVLSRTIFVSKVTAALNMLVQNMTMLETNTVSGERIVDYIGLAPEVGVSKFSIMIDEEFKFVSHVCQ